jgi:hypothetical protein
VSLSGNAHSLIIFRHIQRAQNRVSVVWDSFWIADMTAPFAVNRTLDFQSGSVFFGERRQATRHSHGTVNYGIGSDWEGCSYVGDLRDGYPHGQGTFTEPEENKLVGQFRNGTTYGRGTLTFGPDTEWAGHVSKGNFRDFVKFGWGSYLFPGAYTYIGNYRNGLMHGRGTTHFDNGDKYVGDYRNHWWNGQGTFSWAQGGKHIGNFRSGFFHGAGTEIDEKGEVSCEGVWEHGELISSCESLGPIVKIWAT